MEQKCQISGQIWGQAHVLARYAAKMGKKFFFPRKLTLLAWWWAQKLFHFGHSGPTYKPSKLPQNLPLSVHFGQVCTQWGIFFWHFSLLVQNKIFLLTLNTRNPTYLDGKFQFFKDKKFYALDENIKLNFVFTFCCRIRWNFTLWHISALTSFLFEIKIK